MKRTSREGNELFYSSERTKHSPTNPILQSIVVLCAIILTISAHFASADVVPRSETGALLELKGKIYTSAGQAGVTGFDGFENYWSIAAEDQKPVLFMDYYDTYNLAPDWTRELKQELLKYHRQGYYVMPQIGLNLDYFWEDVISGAHDEQLDNFIEGFKYLGIPAFLRVGYEFNHSERHWDNQQYQEVFKVIANKFKAADLEVAMVFNAGLSANQGMEGYYPGSEYVDWVGYNTFGDIGDGNVMHSIATEMHQLAQQHGKPIMIGEAGPNDVNDSQNYAQWGWFQVYFDQVAENPEIKASTYINWDWNNQDAVGGNGLFPWGDGRLQNPGSVAPQFFNELSDPKYFHASSEQETRSLFFYNDNEAPTAVYNLRRVGNKLVWDDASDSGESGLAHYTIYKDGNLWDYIIGTEYPVKDLGAGYSSEIQITAMDRAGNEGTGSNQLTVDLNNRVEKIWDGEFDLPQTSVALGWRFMGTMDGGAKKPDDGISGNIDNTGLLSGDNSVHLEWESVRQNPLDWKISLFQAFQVTAGTEYKISFQAVAPSPITVRLKFKDHHNDPNHTWVPSGGADPLFSEEWQVYEEWEVEVGTSPKTYEFTAIAPETETARWSLEMGHVPGGEMYVDGISVSEGISSADPIAVVPSDYSLIDENDDCVETTQPTGANSYDPDGEVVAYEWLVNGASVSDEISPVLTLECGVNEITLVVTDNDGNTGSASYKITVSDGKPIVNAGEDQRILDLDSDGYAPISLLGKSNINPDLPGTQYLWADGNIELATTQRLETELAAGTYELTFTVTTESGVSGSDTVSVVIVPDIAPTASISASSTDGGSVYDLTDGSLDTIWTSGTAYESQSIILDLGTPLTLDQLNIFWDEKALAKGFEIQGSASCASGSFITLEQFSENLSTENSYSFSSGNTYGCIRILMTETSFEQPGGFGNKVDSSGNFEVAYQTEGNSRTVTFIPLKENIGSGFAYMNIRIDGNSIGDYPTPPEQPYSFSAPENTEVTLSWKYTLASGAQAFSDDFVYAPGPMQSSELSEIAPPEIGYFAVRELKLFSTGTVDQPSEPPAAPSGLTFTDISSGSIAMLWSDNSNDETGFEIYMDGQLLDRQNANATEYLASNLNPSTTYCFVITAYNVVGSSPSSEQCATTEPPAVPSSPSQVTANANSSSEITLSWLDNSIDENEFVIYRDGSLLTTVAADTESFTDTGLTPETTYTYWVTARNQSGESETSNQASATTEQETVVGDCGEFGVAYVDNNTLAVYHKDNGWTGLWYYICLNGSCYNGSLSNGFYVREFPGSLGTTYNITFKIQDNQTGQYIVDSQEQFSSNSCTLP